METEPEKEEIKIPVPISLLEEAKAEIVSATRSANYMSQRINELQREVEMHRYTRMIVEKFAGSTAGYAMSTDSNELRNDGYQPRIIRNISKLISDYWTKPPEPPIPATAASIFEDSNNGAVNNGNGDQLFPTITPRTSGGDNIAPGFDEEDSSTVGRSKE